MAHESDFRRAANVFKVLSNPGRLQIVCSMMGGKATNQTELIDQLGWPQSTVNRHLTALRDAGLVASHREGTRVHLALEGSVTNNLLHAVCDWLHSETGETMSGRLKEMLAQASASSNNQRELK